MNQKRSFDKDPWNERCSWQGQYDKVRAIEMLEKYALDYYCMIVEQMEESKVPYCNRKEVNNAYV